MKIRETSFLVILACTALLFTACEPELERIVYQSYSETQPKLVQYFQETKTGKVKVKEEKFYEDGTKEYIGSFDEKGNRHGEWRYYYPNGNLWSLGEYENGLKHGKKEVYWPDGTKRYNGQFQNDIKSGKWTFYNTDGSVLQEMDFGTSSES